MSPRDKLIIEEIEAAIARVLEAERAAQASIDVAARQSATGVAQARERARLILETADRRILAVRRAVAARIAGHQAGVDAAIRRLRDDAAPAGADPRGLASALDMVAAALTSGKQP